MQRQLLDIRTIPGFSHEEIIENAHKIAKDMENKKPRNGYTSSSRNNRPPLTMDKEDNFIKGNRKGI